MNYRNPLFSSPTTIDCEIEHPVYGWIPFTCSPTDTYAEFDTAALFHEMGPHAAPYVPPAEPTPEQLIASQRSKMVVSRFQAKAALLQAGLLSAIETAVSNADVATQLAWAEAVEFRRTSPTIAALASSLGLTDEQLDALFINAATIVA